MNNGIDVYVENWKLNFESDSIYLDGNPEFFLLRDLRDPLESLESNDFFYVHSTSWRFDEKCGIVLTFVSLQRDSHKLLIEVQEYLDNQGSSSKVLKHALRHLSFLTYYDPNFVLLLDENERSLLRKFDPLPAGLI